jgi:hypothetical protein
MPSSLIFSHCKRCGRKISNPKAQAIGYGKTCFRRYQAEQALKNGMAKGEQGQESLISFIF